MKKSEAIELLTEFVERKTDMNGRVTSRDIIDFLEKEVGMKPPENGLDYEGYGSGDDYFCISTPSYKWEIESA